MKMWTEMAHSLIQDSDIYSYVRVLLKRNFTTQIVIKHRPGICQHLYIGICQHLYISNMRTTSKNGTCKLDISTIVLMKIQVWCYAMLTWNVVASVLNGL
jgi:hypothetical protein